MHLHTATYEKERLKILAFRLLKDYIKKCCDSGSAAGGRSGSSNSNSSSGVTISASNSIIIKKTIFPTVCKALFTGKLIGGNSAVGSGEVRVAAADVLKEIQNHCTMGDKVCDWVEDNLQRNELNRLLRT